MHKHTNDSKINEQIRLKQQISARNQWRPPKAIDFQQNSIRRRKNKAARSEEMQQKFKIFSQKSLFKTLLSISSLVLVDPSHPLKESILNALLKTQS